MSNETEVELEVGAPGEGMEVDIPAEQEDPRGKVAHKEELTSVEQDEENTELRGAETDAEREAIRVRRREERKHRKVVGREREQAKDRLLASLQLQVQELSDRLHHTDRKQSSSDFAKLEEELNQAISTANEAREHLKNSAAAQDGEGVAEATELYYTARRRAEYLSGVRQKITKQSPEAPQLDPRLVNNANKWLGENKWYNHSGDDVDSVTAKAVDNQLTREGYDARTPEYWEELNDRLASKLPHRFGKVQGKGGNSSPPVSGGDRNSPSGSSGGKTNKFFLSAERVTAIKDLGVWDDEKARNKLIESYRKYDKEKGVNK